MPTIEQSRSSKLDMSNYTPVEVGAPPIVVPTSLQPQSVLKNAYLRCPFPDIGSSATPDTLRQFYANNSIPQRRTFV